MMGRAPHQSSLLRVRAEDERAVSSALERCDIAGLADRAVAELSGGERRRVTLARALRPAKVLLLDEPAAHLDARHAVSVGELVREEVDRRGIACIAVLHDLAAAARWADRVVLAGGKVRADGAARRSAEARAARGGVRNPNPGRDRRRVGPALRGHGSAIEVTLFRVSRPPLITAKACAGSCPSRSLRLRSFCGGAAWSRPRRWFRPWMSRPATPRWAIASR